LLNKDTSNQFLKLINYYCLNVIESATIVKDLTFVLNLN